MNDLIKQATQEMICLKGYFPYRIIWAAIKEETSEVITGASTTKRAANDYIRKGYAVYTL